MTMLTIDGLKQALNHVQDNGKTIKYHGHGPKSGLIVIPDGMPEEEAYHLRVVQLLEPKLISRLAEEYTVLSLDGQELLDVLSDTHYLDGLTAQLKQRGYTAPSDRQVFRLLRENMMTGNASSWPDVVKSLLDNAAGTERVVIDAGSQDTAKTEASPLSLEEKSRAATLIKTAKKQTQVAEA